METQNEYRKKLLKFAVIVIVAVLIKLLLPVSHCNNQVIGVRPMSLNDLAREAVERLRELL